MLTAVEEGKESGVKFFNDWVEDVKRVVPKDRLLVFEVKQGWKPLCEFLDLPIPEGDFPRYYLILHILYSTVQVH